MLTTFPTYRPIRFARGERVVLKRDPDGSNVSDFLGRGIGVGTVVLAAFADDNQTVAVDWPEGVTTLESVRDLRNAREAIRGE